MRNKTHELCQQEPLFRKGLKEEIKYYINGKLVVILQKMELHVKNQ